MAFWANGLRVAISNPGAIQRPNGLSVNAGARPGEASHSQVGEIIVFNRALSRPERERIDGHLHNKWLRN